MEQGNTWAAIGQGVIVGVAAGVVGGLILAGIAAWVAKRKKEKARCEQIAFIRGYLHALCHNLWSIETVYPAAAEPSPLAYDVHRLNFLEPHLQGLQQMANHNAGSLSAEELTMLHMLVTDLMRWHAHWSRQDPPPDARTVCESLWGVCRKLEWLNFPEASWE